MHGSVRRFAVLMVMVGLTPASAQAPNSEPAPTRQVPPPPAPQGTTTPAPTGAVPPPAVPPGSPGLTLPEGDNANIAVNSTERFTVAPLKLYGLPRSTREDVAEVRIVRPAKEGQLPDSFDITTKELLGATTIILPLVKEGEPPFERRIDFLVVDEISTAYKAYLETTIKRMFPTVSVELMIANSQTAVLNGYVDRAELVSPIENLVRGFLAARTGTPPETVTIVNALRVTGAQQVQLKVIIAEVNRSKLRSLGFDWAWLNLGDSGLLGSISNTTGSFIGNNRLVTPATAGVPAQINVVNPVLTGSTMNFTAYRPGTFAFFGFLRALVTNSLGKILAEPVLVTMSGQPAFFNVGGEVPILLPQGNATISINYRPFGTNLSFVPTVLGDGRIRLEVRPEVSERSDANGIVIATGIIPGFVTRVAETTVELENGQTFAIAGLIQQRVTTTTNKTPILGDLPLFGWAFQNKSYQQADTELLIMVTPHLVSAMDERPCKLPGRESRIPNDLEWYLGSKFEPPCFDDPYRNHWHQHFHGPKPSTPMPDYPFDNYGRPPGMLMTPGAAVGGVIPGAIPNATPGVIPGPAPGTTPAVTPGAPVTPPPANTIEKMPHRTDARDPATPIPQASAVAPAAGTVDEQVAPASSVAEESEAAPDRAARIISVNAEEPSETSEKESAPATEAGGESSEESSEEEGWTKSTDP